MSARVQVMVADERKSSRGSSSGPLPPQPVDEPQPPGDPAPALHRKSVASIESAASVESGIDVTRTESAYVHPAPRRASLQGGGGVPSKKGRNYGDKALYGYHASDYKAAKEQQEDGA